MGIRPGSAPVFDPPNGKALREQWVSAKMQPSLRFVIITATMIYYELGGRRCRILRLRGNTPEERESIDAIYKYGAAADIAVAELVDGRRAHSKRRATIKFPRVQNVVDRINFLFPTNGNKPTASYRGDHIHLEVPLNGFTADHQSMATWFEAGPTGDKVRL